MQQKSVNGDAARRRLILDAARNCFLRFGYTKTSLEDIAKQAAISRPLIYLKFKSKEEIFAAVVEDIFEKPTGPRSKRSQSLGANGIGCWRSMRLCCSTRGRS